MLTFCNSIVLDFTRYKKYLRAELEIHRYFPDDLFPRVDNNGNQLEEEPMKILSFS